METDYEALKTILRDGGSQHAAPLPNASFIGVTGTPIEQNDANTGAVFGEYVAVYDIQQAVIDKATVPIHYESRIAKLSLNEAELPKVDLRSRKSPKGKKRIASRSSRPTGPRWKHSSAARNGVA